MGVARSRNEAHRADHVPNRAACTDLVNSYLELGEYAFDFAVVFLGVRGGSTRGWMASIGRPDTTCPQRSRNFKRVR